MRGDQVNMCKIRALCFMVIGLCFLQPISTMANVEPAEYAISELQEKGVIGAEYDTASLDVPISFGEFCTMLDRLYHIKREEYIQGETVTRAEASVIINRLLNISSGGECKQYLDYPHIPVWARESVCGMQKMGLLDADQQYFRPNQYLTKGECAVLLQKIGDYDCLLIDYVQILEEEKSRLDAFAFSPAALQSLDQTISSLGNNISVYYQDIESGYTYAYNENQKYFIASLIKAPYCMYIYTLASQGECDLEKQYIYQSRHIAGGTGKIQHMKLGSVFSMEELISYAIQYSDNVAMRMIKEQYPPSGYGEYARNLGLHHPEDVKNATNGNITAVDAGVYMNAIYQFIHSNPYGPELRKWMLSTTNPLIVSQYPVVRKYGWMGSDCHDMAIIEAPRPYILCICTKSDGNRQIFKKISETVEQAVLESAAF